MPPKKPKESMPRELDAELKRLIEGGASPGSPAAEAVFNLKSEYNKSVSTAIVEVPLDPSVNGYCPMHHKILVKVPDGHYDYRHKAPDGSVRVWCYVRQVPKEIRKLSEDKANKIRILDMDGKEVA